MGDCKGDTNRIQDIDPQAGITVDGAIMIRDIETSDRYFWKTTLASQLAQRVYDKVGNIRELSGNEVLALALNEAAVFFGRGFFYYLVGRDSWKRVGDASSGRSPPMPSAEYPAMAYMDFIWSTEERAIFFKTSHRSRYLMCNSLINPPLEDAPVYPIQYASHKQSPLYTTTRDTLVILTNSSHIYLATCGELASAVGRPKGKLGNIEPEKRIATMPWLWRGLCEQQPPEEGVQNRGQQIALLQSFQIDSLETLYWRIRAVCKHGGLVSTVTGKELWQVTPRPAHPAHGIELGTPLASYDGGESPQQTGFESSRPKSRMGGRLPGRGRGWGQ